MNFSTFGISFMLFAEPINKLCQHKFDKMCNFMCVYSSSVNLYSMVINLCLTRKVNNWLYIYKTSYAHLSVSTCIENIAGVKP